MYRMLAEVIKVRKFKPIKDGNFQVLPVRCKVRIREPAAKGFKLPPHIKGKKGWIKRSFVSPWEPSPGDFIILSPEEVQLFMPKLEGDINADGFKEEVIENEFLRTVILPHYGAKIGSLIYKANGKDKFNLIIKYGKEEWIDMGGVDTLIEPELPGSLWNAKFKVKQGDSPCPDRSWDLQYQRQGTSCLSKGVYEYEKGGIKITKSLKAIEGLPILYETVNIKSKKKKPISFWWRISFNVGDKWWENVVFIPTHEKLYHKRYCRSFTFPWMQTPEYYGLNLGGWLFANENGNLLWLTNSKICGSGEPHLPLIDFVNITDERFAFVIAPHAIPIELKKGEEIKYGCIWGVGESYEINSNTIAIGSRAILQGNKILFSIVAKSKTPISSAKIYWDKHEIVLPLEEMSLDEMGKILVGKTVIDTSSDTDIKFKL